MRDVDVRLHIEPDGEGGYVTTSPDVPGLVLSTRTAGEAVELAPKVIRDMIEVWRDAGHPLPSALGAVREPIGWASAYRSRKAGPG